MTVSQTEKTAARAMLAGGMTTAEVAAFFHVTPQSIRRLFPKVPTTKPKAVAAPRLPEAPPPPPPPPPHPWWSPDRDALVLETKGRYAALCELAVRLGRPIRDITARWHRLRAI